MLQSAGDEQIIRKELGQEKAQRALRRFYETQSILAKPTPLLWPALPTEMVDTPTEPINGNVNLVSMNGIPLYYAVLSYVDDDYMIRQVLHHDDDEFLNKFVVHKHNLPVVGARKIGAIANFFFATLQEAYKEFDDEFYIFTNEKFKTGRYTRKKQTTEEAYKLYAIGRPEMPLWNATGNTW